MNAADFLAWRLLLGGSRHLSERETAQILGCSREAVRAWSTKGAPLYIAYACAAISAGISAFSARV